jgi:hypothetical protein
LVNDNSALKYATMPSINCQNKGKEDGEDSDKRKR